MCRNPYCPECAPDVDDEGEEDDRDIVAAAAQLDALVEEILSAMGAEAQTWNETAEGDQDDTIEFDADLAFELLGDR